MNWKKTTTLSGMLMRPLTVGECAFIRYQGRTMRTSRVVAIKSVGAGEICFETMNTHYRLLPESVPEEARETELCLAA